MFQFPGFALLPLCIQGKSTCFNPLLIPARVTITDCQVGFPIRKFLDQSLFSAPHDLSQSTTSFIASYCQGIHQTPFSRLIRSRRRQAFSGVKSFRTFPVSRLVRARDFLVSVLDLDNAAFAMSGDVRPTRRPSATLIVYLSARCQFACRPCGPSSDVRPVGRSNRDRALDGSNRDLVEPIGIEPMTLCLQSRCSPS